MKDLYIPSEGDKTPIINTGSFVILGANGSGKSHFGAWIEKNNEKVLRISAQRALSIPDTITIKSEDTAWNKIEYGNETNLDKSYKWNWGNETTTLVNDYESVLTCVFARQNKQSEQYMEECKEKELRGETKPNVPKTIKDRIYDIWNSVFPHRSIIFKDAQVKAQMEGASIYKAKHMSDGERVAIYLISLCLVAPSDTIIVIDEPEIHLHKSIMHTLWDNIEENCQDKTFVYITHDLDFATSRKNAQKIWIKSFDGSKWEMSVLPEDDSIPDDLFFEVLGGRKPILFVEGDKGSYDNQIYPYLYPEFSVIPCHNCSKVIELTRAFRNERVAALHTNNVKGLIDHDYLTQQEIESYRKDDIYTLQVAEIENLYLVEDVIKTVANHLGFDPQEKFDEIKRTLFDQFQNDYEMQLSSMCTKEIRHLLNNYERPKENTSEALESQLTKLVDTIDVKQIYNVRKSEIDTIIATKDYSKLLMVYNQKSLHNRISSMLGLGKYGYPQLVLRLLKTDKKEVVISAMKKFVPHICK